MKLKDLIEYLKEVPNGDQYKQFDGEPAAEDLWDQSYNAAQEVFQSGRHDLAQKILKWFGEKK